MGADAEPRHRYIEGEYIDGEPRLHTVEWGPADAPTVLLLHGSTQHAGAWEGVAGALDGYRAVALDLRGHGGSERSGGYAPDGYVRDVERAVEATGGGPVAIAGHSMGSLVAMRYAAEHPSSVWAAAFLDIDARVPDYQVEHLHEAGERPPRAVDSLDEARARVAARNPGADDAAVERLLRAGFVRDADGRYVEPYDRRTLREFAPWDNRELLPRIGCPALVVRGGDSIVHDTEAARAMAEALPRGRLWELPGADHMLHIVRCAEVAAALRAFLTEASAGR